MAAAALSRAPAASIPVGPKLSTCSRVAARRSTCAESATTPSDNPEYHREVRETVADESQVAARSGTATGRRGFLSSLVPHLDDRISPEFYRLSGKLRALVNVAFLIANVVMAPQVESLGFDPHVHWRFFFVIC